MKLFVYEYITSGALADQSLPESLAHEGNEMLSAIVRDCNDLSYFSISIIRDARLTELEVIKENKNHHCHFISNSFEHQKQWQLCLSEAEAVFIIAPETEGILAELHHQALSQNKVVLGCQVSAIETTSNKRTCHQRLKKNDIAVADTYLATHFSNIESKPDTAYLTKPIDGAGCLNTYVFDSAKELNHYLLTLPDVDKEQTVIQPFIKGIAASLSLLFSDTDVSVLSINEQQIELKKNQLIFIGCHVNSIAESAFSSSQAYHLARQIQKAIPGLWGFVGIDFIITEESSVIVDINPRVTSAYMGLKSALKTNPMRLLFQVYEKDHFVSSSSMKRQMVEVTR